MRGVLFDLDGVLADSEPMHEAAVRFTLREAGGPPPDENWTRYVGLGDRQAFARIYAEHGREAELDGALMERLISMKLEDCAARIGRGEFRAHEPVVALLREAAGEMPVAVCSGSRRREVEGVLRGLGVMGAVSAVVSVDEVQRPKPDPQPYEIAAENLGLAARDCVVLEDTPVGTKAGLGAGAVVVGLVTTNTAIALRDAGAHEVVEDLAALSVDRLRWVWSRVRG